VAVRGAAAAGTPAGRGAAHAFAAAAAAGGGLMELDDTDTWFNFSSRIQLNCSFGSLIFGASSECATTTACSATARIFAVFAAAAESFAVAVRGAAAAGTPAGRGAAHAFAAAAAAGGGLMELDDTDTWFNFSSRIQLNCSFGSLIFGASSEGATTKACSAIARIWFILSCNFVSIIVGDSSEGATTTACSAIARIWTR